MGKGKRYLIVALAVLVSLLAYSFLILYVERHDNLELLGVYTVLFLSYVVLIAFRETSKIGWLVAFAIVCRLLFMIDLPALSDDIYRFVWDGRLLIQGIEPFAQLPSYYMQPGSEDVPGITSQLFALLNSPDYYTVYPPLAQDIFWIAVKLFPNSVMGSAVVMRLFIISAECGSIFLLIALLRNYGLDKRNALLYALNPLVIIELTGNLHFEAIMIFFLLLSVYSFSKNQLWPSALCMALAIATKLIPLIFLPIFLRYLPFKRCLSYYGMIFLFTVLLFLPMARPDLIHGMTTSLALYFQKFEFNASIYYLVRYFGFRAVGYNIIGMAGKILPLLTLVSILFYTYKHKYNSATPGVMLWCLFIYLLFSTTIHPWYITPLLVLSVFTQYRFVVIWSFLIFLSYLGYSQVSFNENLWLTGFEYGVVIFYLFYEIYLKKRVQFSFHILPKHE
ncbi:glycosyltransferase 87 family protein [Fulvivirga sediminis]|uniref:Mannosyltransferase n=1 Tax=Fulvivirga sediminis TaxID=2803949 RepID=A0A937F6M5_9BACT|nr:glycosyltransferase 87 family protein [Fulvivirga sediminis]MBL3655048.1 hypothetical protein [Fulvivirga sediminis]